ncbi:MAG: septum formation initiator family protein [Bacteroidota bacterium]
MRSSNNNLIVLIIIAILFIAASAFIILNENGLIKYLKVRSELNQMDTEIKNAEEKLKVLEQEIDSLKSSKEKLERVAREKYHMIKKTESVFRVEEK